MRVVRLLARQDFLPRMNLPRHPQGLEIRHCAAAAEMPKKILPAEHGGNFRDRLFFHRGSGAPAVQRMIVRIQPHGQRVGQPCHRVRRLQHLPGVQRMKIRIVIV